MSVINLPVSKQHRPGAGCWEILDANDVFLGAIPTEFIADAIVTAFDDGARLRNVCRWLEEAESLGKRVTIREVIESLRPQEPSQ